MGAATQPPSPEEVLDNQCLVSARESRNQAVGSTTQAPVKIRAAHHVSNQINSPWRERGHALMTDATRQPRPGPIKHSTSMMVRAKDYVWFSWRRGFMWEIVPAFRLWFLHKWTQVRECTYYSSGSTYSWGIDCWNCINSCQSELTWPLACKNTHYFCIMLYITCCVIAQ